MPPRTLLFVVGEGKFGKSSVVNAGLIPALWREAFRRLTEMSDGQVRFLGLSSMVAGVLLLYLVR